jgi:hypothetical protein
MLHMMQSAAELSACAWDPLTLPLVEQHVIRAACHRRRCRPRLAAAGRIRPPVGAPCGRAASLGGAGAAPHGARQGWGIQQAAVKSDGCQAGLRCRGSTRFRRSTPWGTPAADGFPTAQPTSNYSPNGKPAGVSARPGLFRGRR